MNMKVCFTVLSVVAMAVTDRPMLAQGDSPLAKFEAYVKSRIPQLPAEQVGQVAKLVDKDGNGKISDAEFQGRMRAVATVRSGAAKPKPGARPKPGAKPKVDAKSKSTGYLDGDPVVVPPVSASDASTLLLITTVSCNTGEYDSARDPSIVESMLRAPKAGSVAVVAPIRTGKPHFHSRSDFRLMVQEGKLDGTTMTMTRYWQNGLAGATTGEAIMAVKKSLEADARKTAGFHLCICELNLLGDPTLRFRAVSPKQPKIEVVGGVTVGKQRVLIQTDAPGATVCLWKGHEVYEVAIAGWDGCVSMNIAPKSPGDLVVTAAGAGLNTTQIRVVVGEQ